MTKDEALKVAIKAMENSNSLSYEMMHAIADCKDALAQPEEEKLHPVHIGVDVTKEGTAVTAFYRKHDAVMEMFYSQFHPLAQPEQEPVAWEQFYPDIGKPQLKQEPSITKEARGTLILHSGWDDLPNGTKFYTTPPKQEPHNFCPRCGKRLIGMAFAAGGVHTCTPPRGLEMT